MSVMEISIMHHMVMVLLLLWLLSYLNRCHPVAYFVSLIYLYLVHERYVMRLRRKLQFEERKQSNQRRVLTDSETVRWLNHAVEKMWPICVEQICSQKILLPIIPWFLEKYKPWTAKKAVVQSLYLGRNPPLFTEMRVLHQPNDDDHLVLELGMNFRTADDMSAILAVKLRRRLGFGMVAKLHLTGMHVEGKVLVGVKFLRQWPFLGRVRVCFAEPPYFQMTVKPMFSHGLDVTELPGIAGWLDKLLSVAFEQTLVEPNMLVVDMEKFASPQPGKSESWFSVDEKEPVAYAKVEVVEASDMKPSDLNGLADPYVKGQLGPYRFKTQTQKKTLTPKWHEEFKIPICTWESPNLLAIEVCDKDHFVDDTLGDCTVNINDLRDGQRHEMWLSLQNIKTGRLHLAITVFEDNAKEFDSPCDGETLNKEDIQNAFASETTPHKGSFSSGSSEKSTKVADNFEPINVEGQQETGIWVHHPGSEVAQTWEPRKGKSRRLDTKIDGVPHDSFGSTHTANKENSSADESPKGKHPVSSVRRGIRKIRAAFHGHPKKEDHSGHIADAVRTPYANVRAVNAKEIGVKLVVEDPLSGPYSGNISKDGSLSPEGNGSESRSKGNDLESPSKGNVKVMAKSILKHAEKSAHSIKHALSRKGSRRSQADAPVVPERDIYAESDSSDDESLSSHIVERIPVVSNPISGCCGTGDNYDTKEHIVQTGSTDPVMNTEDQTEKVSVEGLEKMDDGKVSSPERPGNGLIESLPPKLAEEKLEGEKRENLEGEKRENLKGEDREILA